MSAKGLFPSNGEREMAADGWAVAESASQIRLAALEAKDVRVLETGVRGLSGGKHECNVIGLAGACGERPEPSSPDLQVSLRRSLYSNKSRDQLRLDVFARNVQRPVRLVAEYAQQRAGTIVGTVS